MNAFLTDNSPCYLITCLALLCWQPPCHAESTPQTKASIKSPGADLANFPNSAFTLPQNHAYVELTPFNYSGHSANDTPSQYSAGYLLRYGLTDNFELRLFSRGYTKLNDESRTEGMSPQSFDFKWHVMDEQKDSYLPAMGIEVALQTDIATRAFRAGLLPSLSLNFDQSLPYDIALEYNVGFASQNTDSGTEYQLALSWALQRDIVEDFAVFVNGYTNTGNGLTTSAVGGGLQWTPIERVALFTNVSAGLTVSTPSIGAMCGFAVAF